MLLYVLFVDLDYCAPLRCTMFLGHGVPPLALFLGKLHYQIRGHHDSFICAQNIVRYPCIYWCLIDYFYFMPLIIQYVVYKRTDYNSQKIIEVINVFFVIFIT